MVTIAGLSYLLERNSAEDVHNRRDQRHRRTNVACFFSGLFPQRVRMMCVERKEVCGISKSRFERAR